MKGARLLPVSVAFVTDAFARRIVGWKASTLATANFVLDALEQAIHPRRPNADDGLIHHSARDVQGGFNRSLQHKEIGVCDYGWPTRISALRSASITKPRAQRVTTH